MMRAYDGRAVLVTGGTAGIGLATALAFASRGARCTLTYKLGSADEDDVRARFSAIGAAVPDIVQADAARDDDTEAVLRRIHEQHGALDAVIVNVSTALVTRSFADYDRRGLLKSIDTSAWPIVEYPRQIKRIFGKYPRYVVGMSSTGVDSFASGYDFVAASKAVMETLCRYMNYRLYDENCRINILRSRSVRTSSFEQTFGAEFLTFAKRFVREEHFVSPEEVGWGAFALCSGLMDGVSGQVLTIDRGTTFFDNLSRLYAERDSIAL